MARWEPNAIGRLQDAALALYRERGFDETTVADIAARAGLTRRTFFRYFTDKREVLFFGAEKLEAFLVESVVAAPASTPAIDAVAAALDAVAGASDERPGFADFARQRHALIRTCGELRERDLIKLASLGSALAGALRRRGVAEPPASLAAEAGIAAFKIAFERWVGDAKRAKLRHHVREAMDELKAVASGQVAIRDENARPKASPTAHNRPSTVRTKRR
jgi:AcrR family transcriptional regulator